MNRHAKRSIDVLGALVGLVLSAPILAAAALLIRLSLGRPVLYRQLRAGLGGRTFTLCKLRTMSEAPGTDAERIPPLGKFLRAWSIDELPGLWNVLRGEMSLVGPRPLLVSYLDRYTEEQARRHDVRPGLTGWAQIHGRNATTWDHRLALDVWYTRHASLGLDLKILARTIALVLRREGISAPGHATMPEFGGPPGGAER